MPKLTRLHWKQMKWRTEHNCNIFCNNRRFHQEINLNLSKALVINSKVWSFYSLILNFDHARSPSSILESMSTPHFNNLAFVSLRAAYKNLLNWHSRVLKHFENNIHQKIGGLLSNHNNFNSWLNIPLGAGSDEQKIKTTVQ